MSVEKRGSIFDGSARADFENLLLKAAAISYAHRQPNPAALVITAILVAGDLEHLDMNGVGQVFADAGLFFEISRVSI